MKCLRKLYLATLIILSVSYSSLWANTTLDTPLVTSTLTNPIGDNNQNFLQGLKNVLIKVSGNPSVNTLPIIRAQFTNAKSFVKSYQTINNPVQPNQSELQIVYNPQAIANLLTKAGQPMWDAKRPQTLVWLAISNSNGSYQVVDASLATSQPLAKSLTRNADMRGLPIIYPLLDLSDASLAAKPKQLLSTDEIQTLANRYHVQSVLAGVATHIGNQWQTQWRYVLDGAPIQWDQPLNSTDFTALHAIDTVASTMIAELSLSNDTNIKTNTTVVINGINDLSSYATVNQCIKHLKHTLNLHASNLTDHSVTFAMTYNDTLQNLSADLVKSCQLTSIPNNTANTPASPNQTLAFQYHGTSV